MYPLTEEARRWFGAEFIPRRDCEKKNEKVQADIFEMKVSIAKLCEQTRITNKWLGVIGGALIAGLIGAAFALIKWLTIGG